MKNKNLHWSLLAVMILVLVVPLGGAVIAGGDKVPICHVPPGNPGGAETKWLPESAVRAHQNHGDERGTCESQKTPTVVPTTPTTVPTQIPAQPSPTTVPTQPPPTIAPTAPPTVAPSTFVPSTISATNAG